MRAIYTLTVFTSAFLLFLIQPMISKMLLPHLGGSPAVWNTAMMFFQVLLLAGYVYVHLSTKWLGTKKQAALHGALLLIALMCLPISLKSDLGFASVEQPIRWVVGSLFLSVGFPFFLLAASAPLMQYWLSRTYHKDAANPYFLYSASNVGSLLALFGYPFVIEPTLALSGQTGFWSLLFVAYILLVLICGWYLKESYNHGAAPTSNDGGMITPTALTRIHWVILAFFPSSLLLGVTTFITTDIASVPLFWVVPLAIYLITFIIAFGKYNTVMTTRAFNAQIVLVPLTVLAIAFKFTALSSVMLLHLFTFFALAMSCHGTLARRKPTTRYLTEYYVWISFGGMLGGVFNSLVAPQVFNDPVEYTLILILCLMLRPQPQAEVLRDKLLDWIVPVLFAGFLWGAARVVHTHFAEASTTVLITLLYIGIMIVVFMIYKRPLRFSLLVLSLLIVVPIVQMVPGKEPPGKHLYTERNFFGVNRVFYVKPLDANLLMHGTTTHGLQSREKAWRLTPVSYYGPPKHAYRAFSPAITSKPLAVLGLGAGTLACLAKKGQEVDFYEIDPTVASIARNPDYFTYVSDCGSKVDIVMGDGRLMLEKAPSQHYGVIVIDVFSSDAIPMHLLTREALAIYASKLADDGVIIFNVSNRHLRLMPVMAALADDAGLKAIAIQNKDLENKLSVPSEWVIMSRNPTRIREAMQTNSNWKPLKNEPAASVWTDNYSNILETLF